MSERIAYVKGRFVPESEANVSILDRGFPLRRRRV